MLVETSLDDLCSNEPRALFEQFNLEGSPTKRKHKCMYCLIGVLCVLGLVGALFGLFYLFINENNGTSQTSKYLSTNSPVVEPIGGHLSPDKDTVVDTRGQVFWTCNEYLKNGYFKNGVYRLYKKKGYNFLAQCVMDENDKKAWIVLQKRTTNDLNFWNRAFSDYFLGFGDIVGDHWRGLRQVRDMIKAKKNFTMRVEIEGDRCEEKLDGLYYVGIWKLLIGSESQGYRLLMIGRVGGNLTDLFFDMESSEGLSFNTANQIKPALHNCLDQKHLGGWWTRKNGCTFISLNGEYTCDRKGTNYGLAVFAKNNLKHGNFEFNNIRPRSTRMSLHVCNGEKDCY